MIFQLRDIKSSLGAEGFGADCVTVLDANYTVYSASPFANSVFCLLGYITEDSSCLSVQLMLKIKILCFTTL